MMKREVTKAIFPVAGLGTRFLPATKSIPKEIMTLVDRPLIQYAIDEARAAWLVGQCDAGVEHDVVAEHVVDRDRVAHGFHVISCGLLHCGDVLKDRRELGDEVVELGVSQLDAREASEVGDVAA